MYKGFPTPRHALMAVTIINVLIRYLAVQGGVLAPLMAVTRTESYDYGQQRLLRGNSSRGVSSQTRPLMAVERTSLVGRRSLWPDLSNKFSRAFSSLTCPLMAVTRTNVLGSISLYRKRCGSRGNPPPNQSPILSWSKNLR